MEGDLARMREGRLQVERTAPPRCASALHRRAVLQYSPPRNRCRAAVAEEVGLVPRARHECADSRRIEPGPVLQLQL
jgi:hypothetical protein